MRWSIRGCIALAVLGLAAGPGWAQAADEWDDAAVEQAIKKAVEYLWSRWANGAWEGARPAGAGHQAANYGGRTALCAYALLAAGVSSQDPKMKQTLDWLAKVEMTGTYATSLRANCWALLGGRKHRYRRRFMQDIHYLVHGLDKRGGYDYVPHGKPEHARSGERPGGRYDNSNTQLGLLGVWVGQEAGIEVPMWYWKLCEKHWVEDQQPDGGWCYQQRGKSYGSMSVAGLASSFICFDALYSDKFIRCKAKTDYPPVVKGLEWLDKNFSATQNPGRGGQWHYYYLYGVERVGLASGYKYFGKKNWYKLGAGALIARQGGQGGWRDVVNTAFALLFLARGRHPILFNKLDYKGTWNSRPRDVANLCKWVTKKFERTVNWQIVHLGVPVHELHDAPILYISGASAPQFSAEDLAKLKAFVLQGGMILSEAACNKASFTMAMQKIYNGMFPEYELKRLPPDHPVYKLHFSVSGMSQGLWGVSNGVRLLVIHSPSQLSLAWQTRRSTTRSREFQLAANVYFFVTDKGILKPRGVCRWPMKKDVACAETLKVVPLRYNGNWNPEPLAWERFAILMARRHATKVEVAAPAEVTALDAATCPVAAMTGTARFEWTAPQRQALAKFLTGGGTLILDAAGGSEAFAEAAEKQIRQILPDARYGMVPTTHALYRKVGPVIDRVTFRRALRLGVRSPTKPRLRALLHENRLAVIFSPDDLTAGLVGYPCWGLKGYEPKSSFDLMRNILLYASGKALSGAGGAAKQTDDYKIEW